MTDIPNTIQFFVRGKPKPQGRPRAVVRKFGDTVRAATFNPDTAEAWKGMVIEEAKVHIPPSPWEGPVWMHLLAFMPRPKSKCRAKDPDGYMWCPGYRNDFDNLGKPICDILTHLGFYRDDGQIVSGHVDKMYHEKGGYPGMRISLWKLNNELRPLTLHLDGDTVSLRPLKPIKGATHV